MIAMFGVAAVAVVVGTALLPSAAGATSDDPLSSSGVVVVRGDEPPKVMARAWVVADADTGEVLAAKNAHEQLRPASTLKTLTAVTLLPQLDLNKLYRVQWEDAHAQGSAVGIVPGSRYTIDDLFYGLMLPSGNDAARALAGAAGGLHHTVTAMNATALALGATDTHAVNPTGLDAQRQVSSAFDLAIFARAGLDDADFRRYISTVSTSFPAQEPKRDKKRDTYMIYNQDPLLLEGYRGILGGKTGYTTQAGRTFVAAVERGGRTLIVSLMGIVEPTDAAAKRLFEWGFAHKGVTAVGSLDTAGAALPEREPAVSTSPPLANGVTTASIGDRNTSGQSTAAWVLVGAVLMAAGWWLSRRRSSRVSR